MINFLCFVTKKHIIKSRFYIINPITMDQTITTPTPTPPTPTPVATPATSPALNIDSMLS